MRDNQETNLPGHQSAELMARDRHAITRKLEMLEKRRREGLPTSKLETEVARLIESSKTLYQARQARMPNITFDESLPVSGRRDEIVKAIQENQVVIIAGETGSGKTTTIGKLASQFKAAGKNVVIAAGDTFRAAAVEQLQVGGERADVPVLTAPEGSDPASLAFEAMTKAEADGADLLMISRLV